MNTDKILQYVWIGRKDFNWYQDCQQVFEELFGAEQLQLTAKLFAATSINTSLKSNITLFRKALYEMQNNLPIGNYLPNIQEQLRRIRNNEPLSGRKINSFAQAMSGDINAIVVDVWILRAFGYDTRRVIKTTGKVANNSATTKQYNIIEEWQRNKAIEMRIEPRQLCSMIWSGVRIITNNDRETHYKNILKHELTNLFNCI